MKKRVISSIVMALVFIPLFIAGGRSYAITMGILSLLSFKELLDLKTSHSKIPNGIILLSMISLLFLVLYEYQARTFSYGISHRFLILMSFLFFIPTLFNYKKGEYDTKDAFYLLGCVILLAVAFNSLIWLRNTGVYHLLYVFSITVFTDIFALLTGMLIGTHHPFPNISPKKTLEGYIGGSIAGTIISSIFHYYLLPGMPILEIILMSLFISLISQVGDLFFSKIKRENNIKDFSNLIPGHGGILDRLDSSIFAVLAYVLLLRFI